MAEYTVKQVSEKLGVSTDIVRRWIKSGVLTARKINPFTVGKSKNSPYLIPAQDVEKLLAKIAKLNK